MPTPLLPYALIFDMDGVIIDNTRYQALAFQLLFRDLGLTTNARRLLRRLNGMPAPDILKTVFTSPVPKKRLEEYATQREFLYRTLYWSHRRETAGLTTFLKAARAAGFKIALGTGSGEETIRYILDHLQLRPYFDVIIGKDDIEKGKPHPDTFSAAARKLGVPPERCLVFEDAVLGEQAAYKAGMRVVAVASSLRAKDFQAPLTVIKDFTELTPERLRELLEQPLAAPKPSKTLAQRAYSKQ
ncbi:haloacid dehalogenase superfamily, subfamily IA, variant 3 with third motif having DD or ED/beta-phosphoglucomutase family hydrolase [Hymenobacter daecheongensis DSM 21074]|uniref:Haloacid dehalogenase superfamily, subfamily IA, variant 3 with third motif having DD or ED/beta-phosphoglucomutase family hydrolase n=1 Tax=Hymenobacter daecheongensis DSM 21074 TaxID=1121955 RepID=A0A1M6AAF1_9BACT|nr:HAD-IA family hydrolase [Hymenobacter daecheongensis]SHI33439.1 haloacid dehalogenase superfamily, subfamily IA, variant 3 with third motif having DD or ED/beta-phosphoglucomutase family hydrolase [Hymenobacter daecheongensis DSM 21074]